MKVFCKYENQNDNTAFMSDKWNLFLIHIFQNRNHRICHFSFTPYFYLVWFYFWCLYTLKLHKQYGGATISLNISYSPSSKINLEIQTSNMDRYKQLIFFFTAGQQEGGEKKEEVTEEEKKPRRTASRRQPKPQVMQSKLRVLSSYSTKGIQKVTGISFCKILKHVIVISAAVLTL